MKNKILIGTVLVLIHTVSGLSSFPVKDRIETKGLNADFQIGLLNLGNRSEKVRVDTVKADYLSTEPEKDDFVLEPSEISRNPDGPGWQYLGNGRYAKPMILEIETELNRSAYRGEHVLTTVLTSRNIPEDTDSVLTQRIIKQIDHEMKLVSSSKVLEEKDEKNMFQELWQSEDDEKEEKTTTEKDPEQEEPSNQKQTTFNLNRDPEKNIESSEEKNTNTKTYALLGGIIACLAYITKQII